MGLHAAAEQGNIEPLKVAIKGRWDAEEGMQIKPDIDGQNKKGRVALHLAACNVRGDAEAVRVVLEGGANANAVDRDGMTALHVIANGCGEGGGQAPSQLKVAKLLHKHGADVNLTGLADGRTPLHVAAASGRAFRLVEWLTNKGAAVNALDGGGATPLHGAVRAGLLREAHALIAAGADPSIADAEGALAADAAVGRGSTAVRLRDDLENHAAIREAFVKAKEEKAKERAAKSEL